MNFEFLPFRHALIILLTGENSRLIPFSGHNFLHRSGLERLFSTCVKNRQNFNGIATDLIMHPVGKIGYRQRPCFRASPDGAEFGKRGEAPYGMQNTQNHPLGGGLVILRDVLTNGEKIEPGGVRKLNPQGRALSRLLFPQGASRDRSSLAGLAGFFGQPMPNIRGPSTPAAVRPPRVRLLIDRLFCSYRQL